MHNYKFRMGKVLKVRHIREDKAHNQLLQARQQKQKVEAKLSQLNSSREELYHYLRQKEHASVDDTLLIREFLTRQRQQIKQVEQELDVKNEQVEDCQQIFIDKRQKRQVMEKLREKDYKRFKKELLDKQQKEIDDIGQRLSFYQE